MKENYKTWGTKKRYNGTEHDYGIRLLRRNKSNLNMKQNCKTWGTKIKVLWNRT
jgi:hypothetical protein